MKKAHALMPNRMVLRVHECVLAGLLIVLMGIAWWLEPAFVTATTQMGIATHAFELAMLALPMSFIIITGGIDLSVGSTMALSAVVMGLLYQAGVPMWGAAAAALGVGIAAGALNGFFVAKLKVHPLLVTLATLAAYRGLAEGISKGKPISGFPESFLGLSSGPVLGGLFVVSALVVAVIAARSAWGAWVYAVGGNERAAMYCGIPTEGVKFALFTLAGFFASVCGIVFAARRNTAKADGGAGIELEVITAVVLGGTSIFGGRGTIIGTVLGVLIIHELREFVSWHWSNDEVILIAVGAILIVSVVLNNLASRKQA